MPLQNRVDPWGTIFRTTARGTFMGNRGGALHDENREIVRLHQSRRWIACVLEFRGRYRTVMSPRRYTELFFLDEAVAFAAGHRPCAECRRARFNAFKEAWFRESPSGPKGADEMDAVLHPARIDRRGAKVAHTAQLKSLPNGAFIEREGSAYLVWDDALYLWTPERYESRLARPSGGSVTLLTPPPIVECFRRGYVPEIHASARG